MSDDAPKPIVVRVGPNERTGEFERERPKDAPPISAIDLQHRLLIDGATYSNLATWCDPTLRETSVDYLGSYLAQMAPRNPTERMLAVQMLW
jgi:hypothetical protein